MEDLRVLGALGDFGTGAPMVTIKGLCAFGALALCYGYLW